MLWTQGDSLIPLDYQFYEKSVDGATKNDHFRAMLDTAKARELNPQCVVFNSWYSSLDNLKRIRFYQPRLANRHPSYRLLHIPQSTPSPQQQGQSILL